jgi:hypothetical protein
MLLTECLLLVLGEGVVVDFLLAMEGLEVLVGFLPLEVLVEGQRETEHLVVGVMVEMVS